MAKPDPTGYAAKTAAGARPYLYSQEYEAWRRNPESQEARSAWSRKHALNKGRHAPT